MLWNRLTETVRSFTLRERLLRERARQRERPPLVVMPPMLGTRLRDGAGRRLWGWTSTLYLGAPVGRAPVVQLDGPLTELALVPGLYSRDVHGGMLRYLTAVGGYTLGEDLAVLGYDWRLGIVDAAERLGELVGRLRGAGDERIDLVCCSSAGLAARHYLAHGGAKKVRRVVYLGTPQRGTLQALNVLQNGFRLAPWLGRHYPGRDAAHCQITYDLLPHPDDPVAADPAGHDVPFDVYDPEVWRRTGLCSYPMPMLDERLERAQRLHRALDAPVACDAIVIGGRHIATRRRLLLEGGRARLVACCPDGDHSNAMPFFGPGDGSVTEESMLGLPGLDEQRVWHVTPREHHDLPSDPDVRRLVVEALLAPERAMPARRLRALRA